MSGSSHGNCLLRCYSRHSTFASVMALLQRRHPCRKTKSTHTLLRNRIDSFRPHGSKQRIIQTFIARPKRIFCNHIHRHGRKRMSQIHWLFGMSKAFEPRTQLLHHISHHGLESQHGCAREEMIQRCASSTMQFMRYSREMRRRCPKHSSRPSPFLSTFGRTRVDVMIIIRVVDVYFKWIDSHNGACSYKVSQKDQTKNRISPPPIPHPNKKLPDRHTIFFMQLSNFPRIPPPSNHIIIKLIPKSRCGQFGTGDFR